MNILFYPKKSETNIDGMVMIYARITINGKRGEFSLGRRIDEQRWDSRSGKLRGTTTEVSNFNRFLDNVRNRLYDIYDALLKEREDISATIIKNIYLGKEGKEYMVLEIFQEHNDEIESLLGKGFTKGTLQRYKAAYKHVSAYIQQNYHRNDIPVRRVDHKFITGLEFFLKSQRNCEHNTAIKYVVNFKKIIRIAYANQWITQDPFFHCKSKLGKLIKRQFDIVKDKLYISESLREEQQIKGKAELIKQAIGKGVFDAPKQQGVLFELVHSLGTKYNKGILSYSNSYRHQVKLDLGHVQLPKQIDFYASPYFVKENEKVLDGFLNSKTEKEIGLSPNAIFLPLMFPNLYDAMAVPYREKFERLSLRTYHKYAERMQVSFEKSPNDYMEFFNEKGFYFVKGENGFEVKTIYTDYGTSSLLPKRTSLYLNTIPNLNETLKEQQAVIGNLIKEGRNNLKNLWAGHLMEKGLYERVAFILTVENVHPNLHRDIARHQMDNGLRKTIQVAMARKSSIQQNHMLRKSVYAVSSLLGDRGKKHDEVFNGFKDELTDWSKYKGKGISF